MKLKPKQKLTKKIAKKDKPKGKKNKQNMNIPLKKNSKSLV